MTHAYLKPGATLAINISDALPAKVLRAENPVMTLSPRLPFFGKPSYMAEVRIAGADGRVLARLPLLKSKGGTPWLYNEVLADIGRQPLFLYDPADDLLTDKIARLISKGHKEQGMKHVRPLREPKTHAVVLGYARPVVARFWSKKPVMEPTQAERNEAHQAFMRKLYTPVTKEEVAKLFPSLGTLLMENIIRPARHAMKNKRYLFNRKVSAPTTPQ
jgi:hypothetical protein